MPSSSLSEGRDIVSVKNCLKAKVPQHLAGSRQAIFHILSESEKAGDLAASQGPLRRLKTRKRLDSTAERAKQSAESLLTDAAASVPAEALPLDDEFIFHTSETRPVKNTMAMSIWKRLMS